MTRILLVDDERAAIVGLQKLLELDGFQVLALDSSRRAIEAIGRESFDALITDLEMPEVGGLEVVRAMRAKGAIPVLVITGYPSSPAAHAALALGARRIIDKPVDYALLISELTAGLAAPQP